MNLTPTKLRRTILLFMALTLPLSAGFISIALVIKDVMVHADPKPLETPTPIHHCPFKSQTPPTKKFNAFILASSGGIEISELLLSYSELARSPHIQVTIIAPEATPLALTGSLGLIPDCTLDEIPSFSDQSSLLIIPSLISPDHPTVRAWLRREAPKARQILALGLGSQALDISGARTLLRPGQLFESSGLGHTRHSIQHFLKNSGIDAYSDRLNSPDPQKLRPIDTLALFTRAAYTWDRTNVGVIIENGFSEEALAALLDTLPRALTIRTVTLSNTREAIRSQSGIRVVATLTKKDSPYFDVVYDLNSIQNPPWEYALSQLAHLATPSLGARVARILGVETTLNQNLLEEIKSPIALVLALYALTLIAAYWADRLLGAVGRSRKVPVVGR